MNENKGMVTIPISEKRAALLDKHIQKKNQAIDMEQEVMKNLRTIQTMKIREAAVCDGIVEAALAEEGYDVEKVGTWTADTEKRTVVVTFLPEENPTPDKGAEEAEPAPTPPAERIAGIEEEFADERAPVEMKEGE